MGKANGVARRRRKIKNQKFPRRSKLQKKRNKIIKKTNVECDIIREAWDNKTSVRRNLAQMGLVADPNKALGIPSAASNIINNPELMDIEHTNKPGNIKPHVIDSLETQAGQVQPKNFKFGPEIVKFCVYMIEKHGDDYEAMCRDGRNHYQESAGQIRKKIKKFKSQTNNWSAYIKAKEFDGDMQ